MQLTLRSPACKVQHEENDHLHQTWRIAQTCDRTTETRGNRLEAPRVITWPRDLHRDRTLPDLRNYSFMLDASRLFSFKYPALFVIVATFACGPAILEITMLSKDARFTKPYDQTNYRNPWRAKHADGYMYDMRAHMHVTSHVTTFT